MNVEEMAAKILSIVEGYQPTTFAELMRHIGPEAEGDYRMHLGNHQNLILWSGASETFLNAMNSIKDKLFMEPTSELLYMFDGRVLTIPIAKRKKQYKTPHWVPAQISIRTAENQAEIDAYKLKKSA